MHTRFDKITTITSAAMIAALSVTAFSQTDPGNVASGWSNGSYQRSYETRFQSAIPAHEGATSLWAALRWSLLGEAAAGAIVGRDDWLFTAEEFQDPAPTGGHALHDELIRVRDALAARNIALIPVLLPDKARMHADHLPRGRSTSFERRYDHALQTFRAAQLPAIDLRPALDFDTSFLRTDTHWSPAGAKAVALALARAINTPFPHTPHADLPATLTQHQTRVETTAGPSQAFRGDLLNFVDTGAFQPLIGPTAEQITLYETTVDSGADLFADAVLPVALIGTSFSAKPDFHFAGFLKQALGVDVLNASRIGQGPFAPMNAFLAEVDALSAPPALVLWEIPERFLSSRSLSK